MQHLVNTLVESQELGVSFVSYTESLDFTSASGKLMFNILAAFAQFERDIISDRVRAGIQNAKSKGKHVGRPAINPGQVDRIDKRRKMEKATEKLLSTSTYLSAAFIKPYQFPSKKKQQKSGP